MLVSLGVYRRHLSKKIHLILTLVEYLEIHTPLHQTKGPILQLHGVLFRASCWGSCSFSGQANQDLSRSWDIYNGFNWEFGRLLYKNIIVRRIKAGFMQIFRVSKLRSCQIMGYLKRLLLRVWEIHVLIAPLKHHLKKDWGWLQGKQIKTLLDHKISIATFIESMGDYPLKTSSWRELKLALCTFSKHSN